MSGERSGTAKAARPGAPPGVDEGAPPGPLALLRRELRPAPGRLGDTLRITVLCLIAIAISETFRTPSTVITAIIVFFVSSNDTGSSILTSLVYAISIAIGSLLVLLVFMVGLSQPALRIPLMALAAFVGTFLSRASALGPQFFLVGAFTTYASTIGDEALQVSMQPDTVSDVTASGLPELAFMPPEEAVVHTLLWLALAFTIPVMLVIIGNVLTGRDPALMLRSALVDRLGAAAGFCEAREGARRQLEALAREGIEGLLKLDGMAVKLHRPSPRRAAGKQLIFDVSRLCSTLLAWDSIPATERSCADLRAAGRACREAERAVRRGGGLADRHAFRIARDEPATTAPDAVLLSLEEELNRALRAIEKALSGERRDQPGVPPELINSPRRLLKDDAFSNPEHARFALKVTLAVMICYAIKNLANWPGIQTCIITCFIVSLDSVGQTVHRATLRFTGALTGGLLGIGAILTLMPLLTDLGDLLFLIAPVAFLAAWIGSGSERVAYGGQQLALAFFVAVLQGYGPTLDMQKARDWIVGVLIGDAATFVVFSTIWTVSVAVIVRARVADALERLADLMELPQQQAATGFDTAENRLRQRFGQAIAQARAMMPNDPYEPGEIRRDRGQRPIDAAVLTELQELVVPVAVILGHRPGSVRRDDLSHASREAIGVHHRAMAAWFRRCAQWVRSGAGAAEMAASLPRPPRLEDLAADGQEPALSNLVRAHLTARSAWYGVLHKDIRSILNQVGPLPSADAPAQAQEPAHAQA